VVPRDDPDGVEPRGRGVGPFAGEDVACGGV